MFGKRSGSVGPPVAISRVASVSVVNEAPKPAAAQSAPVQTERRSETYFQTKLPLDRTSMSVWRGRIGADKLEQFNEN